MEWQEITQSNLVSFKKEGDKAIGKYLGVENGKGKYENTLYNYEDLETKTQRGFFGSAVIDRLMANIQPNQIFKLVYVGKVRSKNGRKVKDFRLFIGK